MFRLQAPTGDLDQSLAEEPRDFLKIVHTQNLSLEFRSGHRPLLYYLQDPVTWNAAFEALCANPERKSHQKRDLHVRDLPLGQDYPCNSEPFGLPCCPAVNPRLDHRQASRARTTHLAHV
jgi:hypothetical protein